MNIVKIIGGLGNQMFQYAFFLTLDKKNNSTKLDISTFSKYALHQGLELQTVFGIELNKKLALEDEFKSLIDNKRFFKWRKLLSKIVQSAPNKLLKSTHFIQPNYSIYYPNVYFMDNVYLDGYWQSEKYFEKIKDKILEIYQWKNISNKNLELSNKMEMENSISIHIRRFDKLKNITQLIYRLRLLILWRVCSKKYYINSISILTKKIDNPKFYIFTDNLSWVKKNIDTQINIEIIDWNRNNNSHWDMYLMSKCKHNIISMSSFSWWGAWLNQNPEKIVIAPKKWALRFTKDIDIIPKSWLRI